MNTYRLLVAETAWSHVYITAESESAARQAWIEGDIDEVVYVGSDGDERIVEIDEYTPTTEDAEVES